MSADLFAEFEHFSQPARQTQQTSEIRSNVSQPTTHSTTSPSAFPPSQLSFGTTAPLKPSTAPPRRNGQQNQWSSLQQSTGATGQATFPSTNSIQISHSGVNDDDDDAWGDFEVAPSATQPPVSVLPQSNGIEIKPAVPVTGQDAAPPHKTRAVRASTLDLLSNNLLGLPVTSVPLEKSKTPTWPANPPSQILAQASKSNPARAKTSSTRAELLFDADDFDGEQQGDDDDFGEFQTVQNPPGLSSQTGSITQPTGIVRGASQFLSGLNLTERPSRYPQAPKSPSFHERNPFPGLALNTPHPKAGKEPEKKLKATPVTAWPAVDNGSAGSNTLGDWGSYKDSPAEKQPVAKPTESNWDWDPVESARQSSKKSLSPKKQIAPSKLDSSWNWDSVDTKGDVKIEATKDDLPPTNVPPPSILLSIFTQLFDEANESLYQPVSGQPFSIKKRILSDPKTIEFLKGYLALATVGARIIAGRRLRWHRDKFLSQRMTISAAGSKGMKLASVDKAQTAREDREATDFVAIWGDQVGRLRSAVAAANSSLKDSTHHLKIPDIKEIMQIQTAKGVPAAPKACLICGLKRDERIPKVDYEVEDSFGEWWTDHWGHATCRRFWLQHEEILRQR